MSTVSSTQRTKQQLQQPQQHQSTATITASTSTRGISSSSSAAALRVSDDQRISSSSRRTTESAQMLQQSSQQQSLAASKRTPSSQSARPRSERTERVLQFKMDEDRENIVKIVSAYLIKNHCDRTNTCFLDEIYQQQNPVNQKDILKASLFSAFDRGERDAFFSKWESLPHEVQENQIDKVEFYLQIYFLIYCIHPLFKTTDKIDNDRIEYFRSYLHSKGSELSRTTELLSFYALPYVPNPSEHQGFKMLFTREWVHELRGKLKESIERLIDQEHDTSPLEDLYYARKGTSNIEKPSPAQAQGQQHTVAKGNGNSSSHNNQKQNAADIDQSYVNEIAVLRANNSEYFKLLQEVNSRYSHLHKIYVQSQEQAKQAIMESQSKWFKIGQDLVQLAKELIGMVEGQMKGVSASSRVLEAKKKKLSQFEHFLGQNIDDLVQQSQDISLFEKQVSEIQYEQTPVAQPSAALPMSKQQPLDNFVLLGVDEEHLGEDYQPFVPLDFWKIKQTLIESTDFTLKIEILQALRWRIVKTRNPYQRREVILSFTMHDVLGCAENPGISALEQAIFNSNQMKLTEFALRLVNALASDFEGRSYLVESNSLVELLIAILKREKEDSTTRRNALGALQKLSLRKKPQIVMIQNELIKWIVQTLRYEKDVLSEYSYEYATALLMNLSLRSLGKQKCEDPQIKVLQVLQELLEHENDQVRAFVNGTLYSLLSRPALKEQSKQLSLLQYLIHLRDTSDDRFNKQLQYIIDQLTNSDEQDDLDGDGSDQEDDNDEDDIEDEGMNEDNDDDDDEEEEDEDDFIDGHFNAPPPLSLQGGSQADRPHMIGENLLMYMFNLRGQEALRQQNLTRTALEESKRNAQNASILNQSRINNRPEPFNRPATPSLSISQISHSQIAGTSFYESKKNRHSNPHNNLNNPHVQLSQNPIVNNKASVYTNNFVQPPSNQQQDAQYQQKGNAQTTKSAPQALPNKQDGQYQVYYEGSHQFSQQFQQMNAQSQRQQLQQHQQQQQQISRQSPTKQPQQQINSPAQQQLQYQQANQQQSQAKQQQQKQVTQLQVQPREVYSNDHVSQQNYNQYVSSQSPLQQQLQQQHFQNQLKRVPSAIKANSEQKQPMLQDTHTKEAFAARPKIPRTPPSQKGGEEYSDEG